MFIVHTSDSTNKKQDLLKVAGPPPIIMPPSLPIALASLCLCLALLAFGPDSGTRDLLLFIFGVIAIAGLGFNAIVWILSGYGLRLPTRGDDEDGERKAIMVFNKINAPSQNRRDTLVITLGAAVIIALSAGLFYYLF